MNKTRRTILVAEDDESYARQLVETFEGEDYEVIWVKNGNEALHQLKKSNIDMGFIDLYMPGVGGMEVIRESLKIAPNVPLVIITAQPAYDTAVKATKLGAFDYIDKPASLERLLITAENAMERRRLLVKSSWMAEEIRNRFKMVGSSTGMKMVYNIIDRIAPTDSTVLITGESGTGKELVARAIHEQSHRSEKPFVRVNCAAIPETLIESELFGHKKGSFTHAFQDRDGKFVQADGGTIFLDEIADMSLAAQAKILRVLQEQELERIGDSEVIQVDVRVIAATNKQLKERINDGDFREDLFYRLSTIEINLPPLRERKEDLPALVDHFLKLSCEKNNRYVEGFEPQALQVLLAHDWPGNVRELENMVDRLVILTAGPRITAQEVSFQLHHSQAAPAPVDYRSAMSEYEREFLVQNLTAHNWNIGNTATALGIDRTNLFKKMKKHGIEKPGA